jgi:pimeloyl-[acyl-carrier protein] synthase
VTTRDDVVTTDEIERELSNPDFFDDPYPTFRQVRDLDPVYRSEAWGDAWLVTGFDEVSLTFRDWKHFSSEGRGLTMLNHLTDDELRRVEPLGRLMAMGGGLISSDPPVHTRIRGLVSRAFTNRVVESLRPKVQSMVDDLLDRVVDAGHADVVRCLALPLPATVIAEMLGVPSDDQARFVEWSDAALAMDGTGKPPLPLVERTQSGYLSLVNYFKDLIADRRRSSIDGRTDLLSTLLSAQDGNEISDDELVITCVTILMGGFETTTSLIVNTLDLLLANPDQRAAAQHDPKMMGSAIEEGLRYESPIQIVMRRVSEPVELGSHRLVPGELVMAMVGAANRDPRQFTEPDRFDITRDGRHVTFGAGIHFCIGAPLARMEAPIAVETILRRMPKIAFAEDRVHWNTAKPSARMPLHYEVQF